MGNPAVQTWDSETGSSSAKEDTIGLVALFSPSSGRHGVQVQGTRRVCVSAWAVQCTRPVPVPAPAPRLPRPDLGSRPLQQLSVVICPTFSVQLSLPEAEVVAKQMMLAKMLTSAPEQRKRIILVLNCRRDE